MINKIDEGLEGVNDFFKSITNRITPNRILVATFINGFLFGLITTGFLGDRSISIYSFTFLLFAWQFLQTCIFSSSHVNFNTIYLQKFIWVGVLGYSVEWQVFGSIAHEYQLEVANYITPPFSGTFANAFFIAVVVYMLVWIFKGNTATRDSAGKYTLYKKDKVS
jgi:hypothetical protein